MLDMLPYNFVIYARQLSVDWLIFKEKHEQ
jgi:hypothetical protein